MSWPRISAPTSKVRADAEFCVLASIWQTTSRARLTHCGFALCWTHAVEATGYVVKARSELLRNDEDNRTQYVFAKDMRGHTERFLLRSRKTD